jgi:hypothetical protein
VQPNDLAFAVGVHRHSDYRRNRDDPAALALLQVGRVSMPIELSPEVPIEFYSLC